jgi:hypothetical protein
MLLTLIRRLADVAVGALLSWFGVPGLWANIAAALLMAWMAGAAQPA